MDATAIIVGIVVGAGLVLLVLVVRRRSAREVARELIEEAQVEKVEDLQAIVKQIETAFAALSREALSANSEDFLKLAGTKLAEHTKEGESALEVKKKLIDKTVEQMTFRLGELSTALQTLDKDRRQSHGSLVKQLETTTHATGELQKTTAWRIRNAAGSGASAWPRTCCAWPGSSRASITGSRPRPNPAPSPILPFRCPRTGGSTWTSSSRCPTT